MNTTKENTGELTATLKVDISEGDYTEKVMKQLREYQRTAAIPGFRKGQVPFGHVNRLYGKSVRIDEIQKCIDEALQNYIKEEKLPLFGHPLSNSTKTGEVNFDTQTEYTFYFDIAFTPEISLNLGDFDVTAYTIIPDDKMVETYLNDVRDRYGKFESPEIVEENDVIYGKLDELDEKGDVKEDGLHTFTTFKMNVMASEAIRKSFIEKKKDDFVDFQFHEAFDKNADVASILRLPQHEAEQFNAKVRVTITGISRVTPHEINEELYKKLFPDKEIASEEAFQIAIRENLSEIYRKEMDRKFLNDATQKMIDTIDIPLPEEFLKRLFAQDEQAKTTPEQIEAEWAEKYVPSLKWQIIEQTIREKNQVEITAEEIKHFLKTQYLTQYMPNIQADTEEGAQQMNEMVDSLMKNNDHMKYIYEQLYDEKLTSLFKSAMKMTEKQVSIDEYKEILSKSE